MSIFGDSDIYETDILNENIKDTNISLEHPQDDIDKPDEDNDADKKESEDEDGAGKKVEQKRRVRRNPNMNLNVEMLKGPRGVHTIENYFKDIKFRGKNYEKYDINNIMKRLELWSHRLHPKYSFDDNLAIIENMGKKKDLQVHMTKYRRNMLVEQELNLSDNENIEVQDAEPFDEMDELLDRQIQISKLDSTHNTSIHSNISFDRDFELLRNTPTPSTSRMSMHKDLEPEKPQLSAEQLAKIAENRMKAQQLLNEKRKRLLEMNTEE